MAKKVLINGQPEYNKISQYNFEDDSVNNNYSNSEGLPKVSIDKFVKKDLYTNQIGNNLNEKIIEQNLKFSGVSSIVIDTLRVDNAGHDYDLKDIDIRGYLFSEARYNPTDKSYDDINIPDNSRFFKYEKDSLTEHQDLGNLKFIEGKKLLSNFNLGGEVTLGEFSNRTDDFNPTGSLTLRGTTELTQIFDETISNPIYIVIYLGANADRSWPIGTDECKKRRQVWRISAEDLFTYNDDTISGKVTSFVDMQNITNTSGDEDGSGGASAARLIVSNLSITISTIGGQLVADQGIPSDYHEYVGRVLQPLAFNVDNPLEFLRLTPERQLFNDLSAGNTDKADEFIDYIVETNVALISTGEYDLENIDLQSYYENNSIQSLQSSAPATISFETKMKDYSSNSTGDLDTFAPADGDYYMFVIDWDDYGDVIKNFDDYNTLQPENIYSLLELRNQGLYELIRVTQSDSNSYGDMKNPYTDELVRPRHTYTTPGIKTIKFITISHSGNELGRWKLGKVRFYLDIPLNQYPDFGLLGGSDYTTIPWPYTTLIIGGTSEDSKYKTSIRGTLGSGKIGDTDVIDERFLISDLRNDEMGKSINNLDLEQIRYFNGVYNIHKLLGIEDKIIFNTETVPEGQNSGENPGENPEGEMFATSGGEFNPPTGDLFGGGPDASVGPGDDNQECFVAGTKVKMSNGLKKNIEDINIGESVKSYNIKTNQIEDKTVINLLNDVHSGKDGDHTIIMKFSDGSKNHNTTTNPYWVKDKSWATFDVERHKRLYKWDCVKIEVGDICYKNVDGQLEEIELVSIEEVFDEIETFNIIVKDNHNYFATDILVHNKHGGFHYPDFTVGCMDSSYDSYNPDATNHNQNMCYNFAPPNPHFSDFTIVKVDEPNWGGEPISGNEMGNEVIYAMNEFNNPNTYQINFQLTDWNSDFQIDLVAWDEAEGQFGDWVLVQNILIDWPSSATEEQNPDDYIQIRPIFWTLGQEWLNSFNSGNYALPFDRFQIRISLIWSDGNPSERKFYSNYFSMATAEAQVSGCTNPNAFNFNPLANIDDNSCVFDSDGDGTIDGNEVLGCTNSNSINYNPDATEDDGSCIPKVLGCTNPNALNYNPEANTDDGTCVITVATADYSNVVVNGEYIFQRYIGDIFIPYNDFTHWQGSTPDRTYSEDISIGQIFIGDNSDNDMKQKCKVELNTGNLVGKSIKDSSGNGEKGLLIGDYEVKKERKGEPMRRDSFIKFPKKIGNNKGAL